MRFAITSAIVAVTVLSLALSSTARAAAVVVPGGSTVAGKTIGQWTADWWNWTGSVTGNAFTDTTGAQATVNQSGPVFFLAGTQGGAPVTRTFQVPANKFLLFPLINVVVANGADPGFADTQTEAGAIIDGEVDTSKLVANIDGTDVSDLASHREKSPANFTYVVKPGSSAFPAGTFTDANSDGYWLMLQPLDPGSHTIHFGGTTNNFVGPDPVITIPSFTVDVTDNVTVSAAAIPLPPAVLGSLPAFGVAISTLRLYRRRAS